MNRGLERTLCQSGENFDIGKQKKRAPSTSSALLDICVRSVQTYYIAIKPYVKIFLKATENRIVLKLCFNKVICI